jgi:hypothetical protein
MNRLCGVSVFIAKTSSLPPEEVWRHAAEDVPVLRKQISTILRDEFVQ